MKQATCMINACKQSTVPKKMFLVKSSKTFFSNFLPAFSFFVFVFFVTVFVIIRFPPSVRISMASSPHFQLHWNTKFELGNFPLRRTFVNTDIDQIKRHSLLINFWFSLRSLFIVKYKTIKSKCNPRANKLELQTFHRTCIWSRRTFFKINSTNTECLRVKLCLNHSVRKRICWLLFS